MAERPSILGRQLTALANSRTFAAFKAHGRSTARSEGKPRITRAASTRKTSGLHTAIQRGYLVRPVAVAQANTIEYRRIPSRIGTPRPWCAGLTAAAMSLTSAGEVLETRWRAKPMGANIAWNAAPSENATTPGQRKSRAATRCPDRN